MKLSTKVAYNTAVQITSKGISTILGLFAVFVMTRTLGVAGFGEYTTVITFLSFFGIAVDFGLTLITAWMVSQEGVDKEKILTNLFTLRFFSALLFLAIAPFAVLFFPYSQLVKTGVLITVFAFFFISLNQVMVGFFQTKLRMDKVSIAEVVGRLILFLGVIISAHFGFGLLGFFWAMVISNFISFLIQLFFVSKFIKIRFRFDFSLWGEIIKKSWPFALTIFFNLLYLKTDTLMLSLMKGNHEVGIYGATYKVIEILTMIPFMFAGILLPIFTASWTRGDKTFFNRVLQKSFDLIIILIVPLIVGTQFLATSVMTSIAGDEFALSGSVLKILIFAAGLVFVSCLFSHIIVAIDKQKEVIGAYFIVSITSIIGYFIFIPRFSYFGAASVTIYAELSICLFMVYYLIKYIKFLPNIKIFPKVLFASFVMGIALYLVPKDSYNGILSLLLFFTMSVAIYFSSLYFVGGITKKDLAILFNK